MTLLFIAALLAGWIDSIAGGGGLISVPILLNYGLSPTIALGTNKFQSSAGSLTAAWHYYQSGFASLKKAQWGIVTTIIGAFLGSWSVQQIHSDILSRIIPIMLIIIGIIALFSPHFKDEDHPTYFSLPQPVAFASIGIIMGFYDGFFGPGTGNFLTILFVYLCGFGLTKATGYTKILNFTSNITALSLFALNGQISIIPALVMAVGQIIGARIGSRMVIRRGTQLIKPLFILVVFLLSLALIWKNYFNR